MDILRHTFVSCPHSLLYTFASVIKIIGATHIYDSMINVNQLQYTVFYLRVWSPGQLEGRIERCKSAKLFSKGTKARVSVPHRLNGALRTYCPQVVS